MDHVLIPTIVPHQRFLIIEREHLPAQIALMVTFIVWIWKLRVIVRNLLSCTPLNKVIDDCVNQEWSNCGSKSHPGHNKHVALICSITVEVVPSIPRLEVVHRKIDDNDT